MAVVKLVFSLQTKALADYQKAVKDIKTTEFEYKVENDSVLYFKGGLAKTTDYQKWAIVRKFSDSYDYVQLVIIEEGKESVIFNLKKITE